MNRRRWFLYFLKRSLSQRKGRVAVASVAVMIATAIVVGAVGVSLGIRQKLGGELKSYGANIIVAPREGLIDEEMLAKLSSAPGIETMTGQLYSRVALNGADLEMIALDMKDVKDRGWKLTGNWPAEGEAIAGVDVMEALELAEGDNVSLGTKDREISSVVSGFVETGGPEDGSVLLSLHMGQKLTGLEGKLSSVLVRARSDEIENTVGYLNREFPALEAKSVRQVAYAEESFLGKMEMLMALVTLVVLFASSICVSSTMSATVLERMKEIGLMKAMGGTKAEIRAFYLAEGCVIGLLGGVAGYLLGYASALTVSKGAFGSYITVPPYILLVSVSMGVLISVSASFLPLADALRQKASVILRGE